MSCPNHPHPTFRYWEDLSLLGRLVAQALLLRGVAPLLSMQRLPYALLVTIRPGRRLRHFRELTARRVTASLLPY